MRRSCVTAALACLSGLVLAQPGVAQPAISDHVTPGGIAFRHAYMPRAQTQSIQIGRRDGDLASETGRGVSVLAPALILRGPKGLSASEFVEDLKDIQAQIYLVSTTEGAVGGVSAPPAKFDAAVELYARVLSDPALDGAALERERANRLTAFRQAAANPATMAAHVVAYLLLPDGPVRRLRTAEPTVFDGVDLAAVERWRQAALARDGLVIAAAGPAKASEIAVQIDRLVAGLPAGPSRLAPVAVPLLQSDKTVILEAPVAQTILAIAGWSGFTNTPETVQGQLAARILQKRLFNAVRERLGAAYGASAQLAAVTPDTIALSLQSAVAHDKAPEALAAIESEYAKLLEAGVTTDEVEPEIAKMISEALEGFRRAPGVARQLRNAKLNARPADHVETAKARLSQISAETVNAAIRDRLRGRALATVIVAPSAAPFRSGCVIKAPHEAERCR